MPVTLPTIHNEPPATRPPRPPPIVIPPTPPLEFWSVAPRPADATDEIYKLIRDLFIIYEILKNGMVPGSPAACALQSCYSDAIRDTTDLLSTMNAVERAIQRMHNMSRGHERFQLGPALLQRLIQRNLGHTRTLQIFRGSCAMFLDVADSMINDNSSHEQQELLCLIDELGPVTGLIETLVCERLEYLYRLEGFDGVDTFFPPVGPCA